ncbi:GNAT family N-acetyltransferase [Methylocapsa palsarum]|uniref:Putative acetyltransferase n=1 Tax=Methylocapsa palsarum TaxID=1612308 RepID=A0A1I3VRE1_9HYPH|nr:GNAT family N-acetyltransferase [Methylocapsa palsarum]SFJ97709.1 putative acetyltransferase [Methylocapsa palsarum]
MTSAISLRQPEDAERPGLVDLWEASWREAMPQIDFAARRDWFVAHVRALEAAGAVTTCAFDASGAMLGFLSIDPQTGYLDQIALAPDAKGGPAAKLLLAEARRLSPAKIELEVNQDNPRAMRFYEREGFRPIAEGANPRSGLKTWRLRWTGHDRDEI